MPVATEYLCLSLKRGALGRMRHSNVSDLYADDPGWLEILAVELGSGIEDMIDRLADRFEADSVRAFHGCHPDDFASYFQHGIGPSAPCHDRVTAAPRRE